MQSFLISRALWAIVSILPGIILFFLMPDLKSAYIIILYLIWVMIELYLENNESNAIAAKKIYDKYSRTFIIACRHLSLWCSAIYIFFYPDETYNHLFWTGISFVILGVSIRIYAILKLKAHFTMTINAYQQQTIINTGLYKYIRHPSYLGVLLIFMGFTLIAGSLLLSIIILILTLVAVIYRINLEEKLLVAKTTKNYASYQVSTKRLIPFIY